MAINLKTVDDKELLYGTKICQGCGAGMAARMALKVLGEKTVLCTPACCFAATTTVFPQSSIFVNNAISAFPGLAATASGMTHAMKALGWDDEYTMLAIAGDGGTIDIGLQGLSGVAERNDDLIYICYDNEAYMNTGVQRSGSTPFDAWTTTTPTGPCSKGEKNKFRKSLFEIMSAHRIPYVATASVAYPQDYMAKVAKAKEIKGCRVIHVSAPCPTGWGYDTAKTVELAKMAVESGLWYLAENEGGEMKLTYKPKELKDPADYLKMQKRFKHLTEEDIQEIREIRDAEWARLKKVLSFE
jgi:pyruvate ferredoxin oxidoreductase beta subunit